MKNNSKTIGIVIGILLFVLLMTGITYAWYSWSSAEDDETLIATDVGTVTVKYDAGPSIIGKEINPVPDKTLGIIKGITIKADSKNVNQTIFDLYLDIKSLDAGLKHPSFKYELYNLSQLVAYGDFSNLNTEPCNNDNTINHIKLLSEENITTSLSNYILYIWIDGNVDNPITMQKQNFEFVLHAVGKNAIGEETLYPDVTKVQEGTLAYKIVNDYLNSENKTMILNNNIKYYYDTTNNLMSDIAGNVRYYGTPTNNYIYFNCDDYNNQSDDTCEKWRIIGVFEDKVKLIRGEALAFKFSFDNKPDGYGSSLSGYGSNNWSDSRLMMLLNPGYEEDVLDSNGRLLNERNRSYYWNSVGTVDDPVTCYSNPTECYFSDTGITAATKENNLISDNLYHLGGYDSPSTYADQRYKLERGLNLTSNRHATWYGKIALAYPSDVLYAYDRVAGSSVVGWLANLISDNKSGAGWLLNPGNSNSKGYYNTNIRSDNNFHTAVLTSNQLFVAPVLYLNANTAISNVGDGSSGSPYRIIVN